MYDANIPVAVARIQKMISISKAHGLEPSTLVISVLSILENEIDWEAGDPKTLLLVVNNSLVTNGNA